MQSLMRLAGWGGEDGVPASQPGLGKEARIHLNRQTCEMIRDALHLHPFG
jgi:hypothetical protein